MAHITTIGLGRKMPGPEKYGSREIHIEIVITPEDIPVDIAEQGKQFMKHWLAMPTESVDCPDLGTRASGELAHNDGEGNADSVSTTEIG